MRRKENAKKRVNKILNDLAEFGVIVEIDPTTYEVLGVGWPKEKAFFSTTWIGELRSFWQVFTRTSRYLMWLDADTVSIVIAKRLSDSSGCHDQFALIPGDAINKYTAITAGSISRSVNACMSLKRSNRSVWQVCC